MLTCGDGSGAAKVAFAATAVIWIGLVGFCFWHYYYESGFHYFKPAWLEDTPPSLPCFKNTGGTCHLMPCFGWRGNVTCYQGRCLCAGQSCAGSDGICHHVDEWKANMLAQGVKFRSANSSYLAISPNSSAEITSKAEMAARFTIYRVPGEHGKVLLSSFEHPAWVLSTSVVWDECSQHETYTKYDADPGKSGVQTVRDDSQPGGMFSMSWWTTNEHDSEWHGYIHSPGTLWVDWYRINSFSGKHLHGFAYDGKPLKHEVLTLVQPTQDMSLLPHQVTVDLRVRPVSKVIMTFQSSSQSPPVAALSCMNELSVWSQTCLSTDAGALTVDWPLYPCSSAPQSQWQMEPPQSGMNNLTWSSLKDSAADAPTTCRERQMLGPKSTPLNLFGKSLLLFPLGMAWYACLPRFMCSATDLCTLQCGWGWAFGNPIPLPFSVCWCWPWCFSWLARCPLATVAFVGMMLWTLVIALIDLLWFIFNGVLALVLMPVFEQKHWQHMDRAILICFHDVGFTFSATPFYLLYMLYAVSELTINWKGWQDGTTPTSLLLLQTTVANSWTGFQVIDVFTDVAALLGYCMSYPAWFSALWAITTVNSCAAVCAVTTGALSYENCLLASLVLEDSFQCVLVLLSCLLGGAFHTEIHEFMIYSAALSVLGAAKSTMLLWSRYRNHSENKYEPLTSKTKSREMQVFSCPRTTSSCSSGSSGSDTGYC